QPLGVLHDGLVTQRLDHALRTGDVSLVEPALQLPVAVAEHDPHPLILLSFEIDRIRWLRRIVCGGDPQPLQRRLEPGSEPRPGTRPRPSRGAIRAWQRRTI